MTKEHRNAFTLGTLIARFIGFKSLGEAEAFYSDLMLDNIRSLLAFFGLKNREKLIQSLITATEFDNESISDWSKAKDVAFVIGNNLSIEQSHQIGSLCKNGLLMCLLNATLRNSGNEKSLDNVIKDLKENVLQLSFVLPENLKEEMLDLCQRSDTVSSGTPEAELLAAQAVLIYEKAPLELENIQFQDGDPKLFQGNLEAQQKAPIIITKKYDMRGATFSGGFADANYGSMVETQHNYASEQRETLADAAAEIQKLLKQLEQKNPTTTEVEKVAYINDETTPSFKRRVSNALKASGETAIDEFILENKYLKVVKAAVKGWLQSNG